MGVGENLMSYRTHFVGECFKGACNGSSYIGTITEASPNGALPRVNVLYSSGRAKTNVELAGNTRNIKNRYYINISVTEYKKTYIKWKLRHG